MVVASRCRPRTKQSGSLTRPLEARMPPQKDDFRSKLEWVGPGAGAGNPVPEPSTLVLGRQSKVPALLTTVNGCGYFADR